MHPPRQTTARIDYRPIQPADMPLLFDIYRHTRLDELAITGWNHEQMQSFLQMQFDIQHRYFQQAYTGDSFLIVHCDSLAIGRLYIGHWETEVRIIDLALLPPYRGKGIGSHILDDTLEQAFRCNKFVSLHIEKNNPALRLYQRLGFDIVAGNGVHWRMECRDNVNRHHRAMPENSGFLFKTTGSMPTQLTEGATTHG